MLSWEQGTVSRPLDGGALTLGRALAPARSLVVAPSSFLRPSRAATLLFSCFVEALNEKRTGETKE
jgi:hypothetical protein